MKANLKGLSGIKGLALRHGEKILITIVGLLAVWFVISSFKLPRLEDQYQADKLQSQITETNRAITESTWPDENSEAATETRFYKPVEKKGIFTVDPKNYPIGGFAPPVVAATQLRGDPIVLNAVGLRAIGSSGLLAFKDDKTLEEQARRQKLKEEELQKKQERDQAKQLAEGPDAEANRRGGAEEINTEEFDPDHPDRRLIEGVGSPAGVPLQGGERLERVHWATVVAKVPIREQLKLFQDTFQNARGHDPVRDFPQYVGYQIQRAEVVPGQPLAWNYIYVFDGQRKHIPNAYAGKFVNDVTIAKLAERAGTEWAAPALEPVDSRWTDMLLTLPLPPLVGRNFGADVTHPDIPLAINAPPVETLQELAPAATPTEKPAEDEDDMTFSAAGTGAAATGQPSPRSEFSMSMRSPMAGPREFGGARGFGGRGGLGGPEGPGYSGGGGASLAGGISAGQRTELPRGVDFLLLRFFDYTVEPGKKYKYRVKIVLNDPNAAIPIASGYLEPAVVDRRTKETRDAKAKGRPAPFYRLAEEWSEPSGTVGIPIGVGAVHIAEAKLPSSKVQNDEPSVKVVAETFDIDPEDSSAIHVAHEKEFRRGAVVNLKEEVKFTGENDRWIDTKDEYELNTGLTVLDVLGADKSVKEITAPTRVLLMDVAGQMTIRDELTDAPEVQYLRVVFSDDKGRKSTNQPGGELGPEGPRGGGRTRGPR